MALHADPVTTEVVGLIGAIVETYRHEVEEAAARHGLTRLQAKALLFVEEPRSMRELAQHLNSDPPNVTGIIDRLESRGLVRRLADRSDRRVKLTSITEAGRVVAEDFKQTLNFAGAPLGMLDADERRMLRDLLRKMRDAADALNQSWVVASVG